MSSEKTPHFFMRNKVHLKNLGLNIFVFIASLAITFILLEITARVIKKEYDFKNFIIEERKQYNQKSQLNLCPSNYDPLVGWVPKERYFNENERLHQSINTIGYGIRSNGIDEIPLSSSSYPILAVGDSFTWGYNVSDNETWPAIPPVSG